MLQDGDQLKEALQFRLFRVDEDTNLSKFLKEKLNNSNFEYARAFYEFPEAEVDLLHYREIIEIPNSKVWWKAIIILLYPQKFKILSP